MSNILSQHTRALTLKTLSPGWEPISLQHVSGQRTIVRFSNNKQTYAVCLHCPDAPCAKLSSSETTPSNFEEFPADRNSETCAALAISIGNCGEPVIDSKRCMMCGVCASRCPVGAIRLEPGFGAVVEYSPNEAFVNSQAETLKSNRTLLHKFASLKRSGAILEESDSVVDEVFKRLKKSWRRVGDRFPNMLARNLLIGVGVGASVGRKGNNHMRMDLVLSPPGVNYGVAEVEFGQEAVLDAPRDVLDALAVLISRYGWALDSTTALIVTDVLPNRRSEYWHVLQDISNVLHTQVGTVTVLALMLGTWNRKKLNLVLGHPFYVDRDIVSYRTQVLEVLMGRPLQLGCDPRSHVDIAK